VPEGKVYEDLEAYELVYQALSGVAEKVHDVHSFMLAKV
jgi:hypothetical protein